MPPAERILPILRRAAVLCRSTPGRTGFLVYPGSVDSLVSALRRVIDDAGLRSDMGRAARLRYEDEYAGAVVARRTAGVFARVAAGKSAA